MLKSSRSISSSERDVGNTFENMIWSICVNERDFFEKVVEKQVQTSEKFDRKDVKVNLCICTPSRFATGSLLKMFDKVNDQSNHFITLYWNITPGKVWQ